MARPGGTAFSRISSLFLLTRCQLDAWLHGKSVLSHFIADLESLLLEICLIDLRCDQGLGTRVLHTPPASIHTSCLATFCKHRCILLKPGLAAAVKPFYTPRHPAMCAWLQVIGVPGASLLLAPLMLWTAAATLLSYALVMRNPFFRKDEDENPAQL